MRHLVLLALIGLAACTSGNKRLDSVAYTPDRVDGSYQGTAYLTSWPGSVPGHWWQRAQVDEQACPHTSYGVIEVGDHTLYYAYEPNLVFNVAVEGDGSLHQRIGAASLDGKIEGSRLRFDVVGPVCTTRYFGTFIRNRS